jgi:hypothetical protein
MKAFFMKITITFTAVFVLIFCVVFAGCTSPTDAKIKPFETTAPAPNPTPTFHSTSPVISTPQTVEALPYERNINIQVEKQRPDASIHLIFIGGRGEDYVQNILMRVTRSDGTVEEKYLSDGIRKPRSYDELVMKEAGALTRLKCLSPAWGQPIRYSINSLHIRTYEYPFFYAVR